jgi:hypothetical protein
VVDGAARVLTRGWHDGEDDADLGDDRVVLSLRPGTWRAQIVVQPEGVPDELAVALSTHPDGRFLVSTFEVIHRRPWLVLAHSDLRVGTPRAAEPVTVDSLERGLDLAEVPFEVATESSVVPLSCVGRPEPWVHHVALVVGDELTGDPYCALRATVPGNLVSVWEWGLLFCCGRDGSFAVLAGGPESNRTVVAMPGRI